MNYAPPQRERTELCAGARQPKRESNRARPARSCEPARGARPKRRNRAARPWLRAVSTLFPAVPVDLLYDVNRQLLADEHVVGYWRVMSRVLSQADPAAVLARATDFE